MESIFKVGDVVRIREDIRHLEDLSGGLPFHLNADMIRAKGTLCHICSVCEEQYDIESYCKIPPKLLDGCRYKIMPLNVDSEAEFRISPWSWSSPMLELITSAEQCAVLTKEMVESAISSFKDALEYATQPLVVPSQLLKGHDEEKEHKLELKVKNVRKVKLNFKN